jgi:hypothetical protein
MTTDIASFKNRLGETVSCIHRFFGNKKNAITAQPQDDLHTPSFRYFVRLAWIQRLGRRKL